MITSRRLAIALSAAVLLTSLLVAQERTSASRPTLRRRALQRFDKDGDGKLSPEERQEARRILQERAQAGQRPAGRVLPDGVKALRDVEYARVDGKPLLLDIYVPKEGAKTLPVVVWIHGGGWQRGTKENCPAVPLVPRGYAVVSINYRLTDVAPFPAQIHDCKAAVRWVRAHAKEYGFDPDRIGVWGASAGGHLVALLGTSGGMKELEGDVGGNLKYSSRVEAVGDFCGPTSFREEDFKGDPWAKTRAEAQAVEKLFGGPLSENREKAVLASPVAHVSKDDPPFLIVHGAQDPLVNPRHAELLTAALKKAGVEVTLKILPDAGHGVSRPETQRMAAEFFDKHLKGSTAKRPAVRPAQ
jgi:acetyl esterase/lipase